MINGLHRQSFPPATRPVAPDPEPIDEEPIFKAWHERKLRGVHLYQRSARSVALREADLEARAEVAATQQSRQAEHELLQQQLDDYWARLCRNDPQTVYATIAEAFEDNECPSAAVGIEGSELIVVVLAPPLSLIPERIPKVTPSGNISITAITKTLRAAFYATAVAGYTLVTAREAFAVLPGIASIRCAVVRPSGGDSYGNSETECLLATRLERSKLQDLQWDKATPGEVLNNASTELLVSQGGRIKDLQPLDLTDQPELAAMIRAVDLEGLESAAQ